MQIIIIKKKNQRYKSEGFIESSSILVVELFVNYFFNESFIQWLEDRSDNTEKDAEFWNISKNDNKIIMSYFGENEEYVLMLSVDQLAWVINEYIKLKKLEPQEIIFLFKDEIIQCKYLMEGESIGFAWYQEKITIFGITPSLNALKSIFLEISLLDKVVISLRDYNYYRQSPFNLEIDDKNNIIITYSFIFYGEASSWTTIIPKDALIWVLQTYIQLTQQPFEQLLLYRTPDRYAFIVDIDKEIVFFLK